MKTKVMYYSRTGNTSKVAEAIARSIGQVAEAVPPAFPLDNIDVLFLGTGVYMGNTDKKMVEFIRTLDTGRVKNVALFGTSVGQNKAIPAMKELIRSKGINVIEESYLCKGKAFVFFSRKHPDEKDLQDARNFAEKVLNSLKK